MISIHALLAESDTSILHKILADWGFLSTLSLRRATRVSAGYPAYSDDFYPRSPCGERLKASATPFSDDPISIHALLAESDRVSETLVPRQYQFLSTLSLRRATYLINTYHRIFGISIHALLAESDGKSNKPAE